MRADSTEHFPPITQRINQKIEQFYKPISKREPDIQKLNYNSQFNTTPEKITEDQYVAK